MPSHLMLRFLHPVTRQPIGDVVHKLSPTVGHSDPLLGWVLRPLANERNLLIGGFDPDVNAVVERARAALAEQT